MTQINLNNPKIIKAVKYIAFMLLLLYFVFNHFGSCSSKTKTVQKVTIPKISGSFEPKKPESKPIEIKQEPIQETKKDGLVYVENPLNQKLIKENEKLRLEYSKMGDSLKSKAYDKAIELNNFSTTFEDNNLKLNINGIVRGEVQEITPSYTIKERETEVAMKETVLRVLIGTSVGINTEFNRGSYGFDVDFMNRKGDMFSAEYLRVNGQDFAMIGIKKSILNIKR